MRIIGDGSNIGQNISKFRTERGLTQKALLELLRDTTFGQTNILSKTTISAVEQGRRAVSIKDAIALCNILDKSLEELLGIKKTNDEDAEESSEDILKKPSYGGVLPRNMIPYFDGDPVFASSKSNAFVAGWCILNSDRKMLVFKDKVLPINADIDLYMYPPKEFDTASGHGCLPLSLARLMESDHVWVDMLCLDPFIQGRYNGWYSHNKYRECLQNEGNGLVLPYSGLGVSYNAFRINSDKSQ